MPHRAPAATGWHRMPYLTTGERCILFEIPRFTSARNEGWTVVDAQHTSSCSYQARCLQASSGTLLSISVFRILSPIQIPTDSVRVIRRYRHVPSLSQWGSIGREVLAVKLGTDNAAICCQSISIRRMILFSGMT